MIDKKEVARVLDRSDSLKGSDQRSIVTCDIIPKANLRRLHRPLEVVFVSKLSNSYKRSWCIRRSTSFLDAIHPHFQSRRGPGPVPAEREGRESGVADVAAWNCTETIEVAWWGDKSYGKHSFCKTVFLSPVCFWVTPFGTALPPSLCVQEPHVIPSAMWSSQPLRVVMRLQAAEVVSHQSHVKSTCPCLSS